MILSAPVVDRAEFERATGWAIKPQGACKGDRCVPLRGLDAGGDTFDVHALADRLGMPVLHDEERGVWCVGPETLGRALQSATAPDLELPARHGREFALSSLRGQKVLLLAWASW